MDAPLGVPVVTADDLTDMIARVMTRDEATALYRAYKDIWQTYHTGLVQIALNNASLEARIRAVSPPSIKKGI